MRTATGALVAAAPVMAACSLGPTYDEWAATDGAAGRINLDEVQEAFKKADSATDFERRVNEIYEGDGIVLIRARQDPDGLVLEGWEDLNKSFVIDDTEDDKLFEIVERTSSTICAGMGQRVLQQRLRRGQFPLHLHDTLLDRPARVRLLHVSRLRPGRPDQAA